MGRPAPSRLVRFGLFEADLRAYRLRKNGLKVKIQEQPFQVLAALLERPGEIVTREELRQKIWGDTFVDFEHSLSVAVGKLRELFGDAADNPRFIETVPRHGYRFIAPVEVVDRRRWPRWLAAAAIVLAIAAGVGGIFFRPQQRELRVVPFVTSVGVETFPTISPDGKMVAFVWAGEEKEREISLGQFGQWGGNIYVQQVGGEAALQRTDSSGADFSPAWSPDGRQIAFYRRPPPPHAERGFAIHVIDALTGPEHTLYRSAASVRLPWRNYRRLAWSPNGELLAFVDSGSPEEPESIFSLSIRSREKRKLTSPPTQSGGDHGPAFSPDGDVLAFIRDGSVAHGIYLLPLAKDGTPTGEPQRLTSDGWDIAGFDWTEDGKRILFAGHNGSVGDLWRIPVSGGEPRRLNLTSGLFHPSVSRQGQRLVCVKRAAEINIWRAPGPNRTDVTRAGEGALRERWIASTKVDWAPKYSPDGKKIAFTSTRSGTVQIWVCDSDGSNTFRLTSLSQTLPTHPSWSPDGRSIAFMSCAEEDPGSSDIYVVSAEGGEPRRLTSDTANDVLPSWSKDGRWVYFGSKRGGDWQIWRKPSGGGAAEQVTRNGGYEAFESADGKSVYYAKKSPVRGIWKVPVAGGEETKVLDGVVANYWDLLKDGICFRSPRPEVGHAFKYFRFTLRPLELVTEFPKGTWFSPGFAVSPDGRWILYAQVDRRESDIMLVENFQ